MSRAVSEIDQEIRALPDGPPDSSVELAWLDEIQRGSRDLDAGFVEAIPAAEVFADLRTKFSRR